MQWLDIDQQGDEDEWMALRVGRLTASVFSKAMANYGKPFGDPAKKLAVTIAREQVTGQKSFAESFSNAHTERGHAQEPIARNLYQDMTFSEVTNGGFYYDDRLGCSPDGLVGDTGMIEIKSVIDSVHYATIKRGGVDPAYKWQVYFQLMTSGREWNDFISYCADFPEETRLYIYRVNALDLTEEFNQMDSRINEFFELVENCKAIIIGE